MIFCYAVRRITKVVDGDTVDVELGKTVDIGFHITIIATTVQRLRLLRADTPERSAGEPWRAATAFTSAWLRQHFVDSLTATTEKSDAFGRYLVEIDCACGANLSTDLMAAGHAVEWTR